MMCCIADKTWASYSCLHKVVCLKNVSSSLEEITLFLALSSLLSPSRVRQRLLSQTGTSILCDAATKREERRKKRRADPIHRRNASANSTTANPTALAQHAAKNSLLQIAPNRRPETKQSRLVFVCK